MAYPPPSTEFDEPDPKRIKIVDLELPVSDKLDKVFNLFADLGWRTDTFMHHFFVKDDANPRSHRHSVFLERVLNGKGGHFLADILNAWWMASDGDNPSDEMYSVTTPYTEMKGIRPALSSFAAQIIEAQLVQEARVAVQESSGLHASVTSKTENGLVEWANLGASLVTRARNAGQEFPSFRIMIVPVQGVVQADVFISIAGRRCIEKISVNSCAERDGFAENKCRAPTGKNPVQLGKRVAIDRGVESAEEQLDFGSVV